MKKFIVFFLLCVFLFVSSLYVKEFDFSQFSNLKVQVFCSTKMLNRLDGVNYVENGSGQILICDYQMYNKVKANQKNIAGVTFIFDGDAKTFEYVIRQLGVKVIENGVNSFVGYSNRFCYSNNYNGKKVNVQGYYCDGKIYVGTPLLLGSY